MYGKNQVNIHENDYDERYIKYHTNHNEVTITFVCDTDGVLDDFSFNGMQMALDAKDDIKLPFEGEFKTIQEIYDATIGDALDLHYSIAREEELARTEYY